MRDLSGKVAVITGGASGIGFALAKGALARGAQVVIADIRNAALAEAKEKLGGDVLAVRTDVTRYADVESLAQATIDRFGKVNLVFNNAGVFASGVTWNISVEEYDWVIDVNLKSVIYGIKAFVPRMIAQGDECHVINTASGAGITVNPGFATYSLTKLAGWRFPRRSISTCKVRASQFVLPCHAGVVQSGIMFPEKQTGGAPKELAARHGNATLGAVEAFMRHAVDTGLPADEMADMVYAAIAGKELYVLPNFTDETSLTMSQAIAVGRATGQNHYPAILAGLLENVSK